MLLALPHAREILLEVLAIDSDMKLGAIQFLEHVCIPSVAKMSSHAIFQYNVLAIDDTHNTWTNMIVKMNISRLLGSSDDKEKRP